MIDLDQAVVLALLQGFTEFLPVSSSAHLLFPLRLQRTDARGVPALAGMRYKVFGDRAGSNSAAGIQRDTVCGGCSTIDQIEAKHTTG